MPIKLVIDPKRERIHTIAEGLITYADVENHLSEENGVGGLPYSELSDARRAVLRWSSGDVRQIVGLIRGLGMNFRHGPTAFLVATDYASGLIFMIGMLVDDICAIKPFRDEAEARAWLGWETQGNDAIR